MKPTKIMANKSLRLLLLGTAILTVGTAGKIRAQTLTETDLDSSTGFTVPASISAMSDLINGQTATVTAGSFSNLFGGGDTGASALADLTDEVSPSIYGNGAVSGLAGTANGLVLTFTLSSVSTVTQINLYTAWANNGRSNDNVTVAYSTDGTTFTTLNTVAATGPNTTNSDLEVSLAGSLSNVKAVQFTFNNQENSGVGLGEIAIYGAAVPEPNTVALLIGGVVLLGFLHLRTRRSLA